MDHLPGSYPRSEPPTPDVYPQQNPYQYQQPQDARAPVKPQEAKHENVGSGVAQQQEHRYSEPLSQAIPAVEGGEVQSHRDDAFHAQSSQQLGPGEQLAQTEQPRVHRYDEPRSEAIPAVLGAQVQAHRDDATRTESRGQPSVHRYDEPRSQAIPAVLGAQVQAHRDNATHSESRQPHDQLGQRGHQDQLQQRERAQQPQQQQQEWPLREHQSQQQHGEGHHGHHDEKPDQETTTPYWGSLPTAAKGGIYNSVTGHPRDDHDQHHGLPERNRRLEDDAIGSTTHSGTTHHQHPSGTGAGLVGTGIYNTVIGHGSQDEHARQHTSSGLGASNPDSSNSAATAAAQRSGMSDNPAHGSGQRFGTQENPKDHSTSAYGTQDRHADSHTGRNVAAGAGVGAAAIAGSRALQEHRASDDTDRHPDPHGAQSSGFGSAHGAPTSAVGGHAAPAARSTQTDTGTHRAFPLSSSSGRESYPEAATTQHSRAKEGLAAGAATGAGVGAYEYAQKHQAGDNQQATQAPAAHRTHEKTTAHESTDNHHHQKIRKSPSPDSKASHNRSSSSSEKQHHGLLGMFSSKTKDDTSSHPKVAEDERGHRKLAKDPPAEIAPAVIAARQASVRQKRTSPERELDNKQVLPAAGVSHGHNDHHDHSTKSDTENRQGRTADGISHGHRDHHDREAASSASRAAPQTSATGGNNYQETAQEQDAHHGRATGTGAGIAAGGLAASELGHRHEDASPSQARHGEAAGVSAGANPTSASTEDSLPHGYSNTHNTATGDKLPYNTLASGTPSGVAIGSQTHERHTHGSQTHAAAPGVAGSRVTQDSAPYGTSDSQSASHTGRNIAAGAGTGAAAVAGSRAIHDHHSADTTSRGPSTSTHGSLDNSAARHVERDALPGTHTSAPSQHNYGHDTTKTDTLGGSDRYNEGRPSESHTGRNLATGAGAGAAAYAGSRAIHDHQATDKKNTLGDPTFTQPAHSVGQAESREMNTSAPSQYANPAEATSYPSGRNHGYDQLASGTPSGVATSSSHGPASSRVSHATQESAPYGNQDRSSDSHDNRASGLAAGAGAGVAAYAGSRAVQGHHAADDNTRLDTDRYATPGLAGEDASRYIDTPNTRSTTTTDRNTNTSGKSDPYDHLASGTASGVAHERSTGQDYVHGSKTSPLSRETHGAETTRGASGRTDPYDHLASGTATGVAAGAAGSHHARDTGVQDTSRTTQAAHTSAGISGGSEPSPYNILSSGTPSGVNIEYRRRSKELGHDL